MITEIQSGHITKQNVVEDIAESFLQVFPQMSVQEQRLALNLYSLLAKGVAVSIEQLASACEQSVKDVESRLRNWPGVFYDDNGCVFGFFGLTVNETSHKLIIDGQTIFTWCAFDALFIPQLLGSTAQIISICPATNNEIRLKISATGVESVDRENLVVSLLIPDVDKLSENVTTSFCHFVYFFHNSNIGEQWCKEHPGTFLVSLEEAFEVGKRFNAGRYKVALN